MVEIPTTREFLSDIEGFLRRHDVAPTTFGATVMSNPAFVNHLRNGRSVTLITARKVYEYMAGFDAMKALQ